MRQRDSDGKWDREGTVLTGFSSGMEGEEWMNEEEVGEHRVEEKLVWGRK